MRIETVLFDHPDARPLIQAIQQEYVSRYGERDHTPIESAEFAPPQGLFLLGYLGDQAVASGGWRGHSTDTANLRAGDAEMKRVYVAPSARGLGLARRMLRELETSAARAGYRRMVLETGTRQPEAITLYQSAGYREIPKFGIYRDEAESRCFGRQL